MPEAAAGPDGAAAHDAPRFVAPTAWKAIDFISDLHLCTALPRTFAAWAEHLRATEADAVFMLGDLFEVWVGDDARDQPFEAACMSVMAEVSRHKYLAFMAGNRDFLLGPTMLEASGLQRVVDPSVIVAWGQTLLLSHGDQLCTGDCEYQQFRRMVRGREWQCGFLARPLAQRLHIAAEIRRHSESRRRFDGAEGADVDPTLACTWLRRARANALVHGHTHRPGTWALAPGLTRHVLSDWDLDTPGAGRAEVMRWSPQGLRRVAPCRLDRA